VLHQRELVAKKSTDGCFDDCVETATPSAEHQSDDEASNKDDEPQRKEIEANPIASSIERTNGSQQVETDQETDVGIGGASAVPAPPPGGWSRALKDLEHLGLRRFTRTQQSLHCRAVREIQAGKKSSCWMWYCFPTPPYMVNGKEAGSSRNRMYAIRTEAEARAFLTFAADGVNLRKNYMEVCSATLSQLRAGVSAKSIFGFIDEPKLRSSVRYFEQVTRDGVDIELNCVLREIMVWIREKPDVPCPEFELFKSTIAKASAMPSLRRNSTSTNGNLRHGTAGTAKVQKGPPSHSKAKSAATRTCRAKPPMTF
jgi:uncharacterized protein (DUF1810 family)